VTLYADGMRALGAAAAAFERAKALGLVWIDDEQGSLFAVNADVPKLPPNPEQLLLEGI
jgi:hypothetical protein